MNVKITREQHNELCKLDYDEYLFGSHLHGMAKESSDEDYIRVISNDFYDKFESLAVYFPNIHSFQHDFDSKTQIIWMTERQFYHNLFSGDGNMVADIVLLSGYFDNPLYLCRTYKIIKGYLGVAKRDLKMHGNNDKKKFHALRSIYMAESLINNYLPTVQDIKNLYFKYAGVLLPSTEELKEQERLLRDTLNNILNMGEIDMYPKFKEPNELVQVMVNCNNIKEFIYK